MEGIGKVGLAVCCLAIAGCAAQPKQIFIRTDGQIGGSNPALTAQFEIDKTICTGEAQKANMSGVTFAGGGIAGAMAQIERQNQSLEVAKGCMAQRGYMLVPEAEAAAKSAQFAEIAAAASTPGSSKTASRR